MFLFKHERCPSLYSVEINKYSHKYLFQTLIAELQGRVSGYATLTDALADNAPKSSVSELLSFIDQQEVIQHFQEIIDVSPQLQGDDDLHFRWVRLRLKLSETNIYISQDAIWIRTYVYPLTANSYYGQTKQCLYISATIGDASDLSRRLGTKPLEKMSIPTEYTEKTSGRRLIIMGTMVEEEFSVRTTGILTTALQIHLKIVWLCSSKEEAFSYQTKVSEWLNSNGFVNHSTWLLTPLGEEIDEFKKAAQGHLFVAGRFDGMDFRADECRIVALTNASTSCGLTRSFFCILSS